MKISKNTEQINGRNLRVLEHEKLVGMTGIIQIDKGSPRYGCYRNGICGAKHVLRLSMQQHA